MDWGSFFYLGVTFALFAIFVIIVARTYRKSKKEEKEAPKYRMLDDE